jgi:hypothetical protein
MAVEVGEGKREGPARAGLPIAFDKSRRSIPGPPTQINSFNHKIFKNEYNCRRPIQVNNPATQLTPG